MEINDFFLGGGSSATNLALLAKNSQHVDIFEGKSIKQYWITRATVDGVFFPDLFEDGSQLQLWSSRHVWKIGEEQFLAQNRHRI